MRMLRHRSAVCPEQPLPPKQGAAAHSPAPARPPGSDRQRQLQPGRCALCNGRGGKVCGAAGTPRRGRLEQRVDGAGGRGARPLGAQRSSAVVPGGAAEPHPCPAAWCRGCRAAVLPPPAPRPFAALSWAVPRRSSPWG